MIFSTSAVAHLFKLIVTILCMKCLGDPANVKGREWPDRAFQILLAHSLLGIFRFAPLDFLAQQLCGYPPLVIPFLVGTGTPFATSASTGVKYLRTFYEWHSRIVDVLPLAFFTTGVLHAYGINERVRLVVLSLGVLPIILLVTGRRKDGQTRRQQLLINLSTILQLLMTTCVGLRHGNYHVISLAISQIFERFFIDEFCYRYEIPSTDLTQYALCFVEIFTTLTLNEL